MKRPDRTPPRDVEHRRRARDSDRRRAWAAVCLGLSSACAATPPGPSASAPSASPRSGSPSSDAPAASTPRRDTGEPAAAPPVAPDAKVIEAFAKRFVDALEANDTTRWIGLFTKAQREKLTADPQTARMNFDAWRSGISTSYQDLRKAKATWRHEPESDQQVVVFEGVKLATDPSETAKVRVRLEDGELRIDEN